MKSILFYQEVRIFDSPWHVLGDVGVAVYVEGVDTACTRWWALEGRG